jgi:hypothetical protein
LTSNPTPNYEIPEDGILPGGRLQQFQKYWTQTTTQKWPISVITHGYQLQFATNPNPWTPNRIKFSSEEYQAVDEAVRKFLKAGIIEESPTQNTDFLSNFFTLQEESKRRPILDCQKLNSYLQCQHFKMEGVPALRDLIEKGDLMSKLDLKDAYVVVPIHEDSKKYLTFQQRGRVYQYKSLPFGLSVAPRVFSKLMRYALEPLRIQGIRLIYYLDDICLLAKTQEEMKKNQESLISHLTGLGFIINWKKSQLQPDHLQEFLGFQFNTKTMNIKVPQKKISKLLQRIKQLQVNKKTQTCRWMASLLGKITAMIPAIGQALLHIRFLQRDLARNLTRGSKRWENPCPLSKEGWNELDWWLTETHKMNGLPIHMKDLTNMTPQATIFTDASDTGWGIKSEWVTTSGLWTPEEREESINVRELKTILFALQIHRRNATNTHIRLFTDSITALKFVKKHGGRHPYNYRSLRSRSNN